VGLRGRSRKNTSTGFAGGCVFSMYVAARPY
jgi:hypothetical protein